MGGAGGLALGKFLAPHLLYARETPYLNREGTRKKGTVALLLKTAGVYTPSLAARMQMIIFWRYHTPAPLECAPLITSYHIAYGITSKFIQKFVANVRHLENHLYNSIVGAKN